MQATEKKLTEHNDWLSGIYNSYNEVASYVPANIKASLSLVEKPAPREKDFVIATSFDTVKVGGVPHLCLIVCYDNGFQVIIFVIFELLLLLCWTVLSRSRARFRRNIRVSVSQRRRKRTARARAHTHTQTHTGLGPRRSAQRARISVEARHADSLRNVSGRAARRRS